MNNPPPTIGILADIGPRSTAPFVDLVVDECQRQYGARSDDEFPSMMIFSLPTPFYLDRPIDHGALRAAILAGLQRLAGTGVAFVAMPCNTAHIYYDDLAASIDAPLLNMVDEALTRRARVGGEGRAAGHQADGRGRHLPGRRRAGRAGAGARRALAAARRPADRHY